MTDLSSMSTEELQRIAGNAPPASAPASAPTPAPNLSGMSTEELRKIAGTPQVSRSQAALEGYLSGASADFRDEIYAASEASGLPRALGGFRAPIGAARLGYEALTKPGKATETYGSSLQDIRQRQAAAKKQHPGAYLAGELGSVAALPIGGAAGGSSLGARAARAAAVGAGYGALSGIGAGTTPTERAVGGAVGGVTGGALGAVAAPATELALRAVQKPAAAIAGRIRGAVAPETEAARRVATAIQTDVRSDPQALRRLTPQEYATTPEARVVDLGGDLTRRLADASSIASPEAKSTILNVLDERRKGQTPRIANWFEQSFGSPSAYQIEEALGKAERTSNRGAYQEAYRQGAAGIGSPALEHLAGSNTVAKAMKSAMENAEDEAIISGYGAVNPRITFTPDGRVQFHHKPSGMPAYPDLQFWDLTRRELSSGAKAAERAGRYTDARRMKMFAKTLNEELDRLVPSYKLARESAAAHFGAENALEAGGKFVSMKAPNMEEAVANFGKMTDSEKYLFRQGFVSRMLSSLKDVGDRRTAISKIYGSPTAREKIEVALGSDKARELEALLRIEGIMDLARQRITGNSWTAQRLVDLGLTGGSAGLGGMGIYQEDPKKLAAGLLLGVFGHGAKKVDQRILRKVAEALISDNPTIQQRGMSIIARSNKLMDSLRTLDQRISAATAGQAPKQLPNKKQPLHAIR